MKREFTQALMGNFDGRRKPRLTTTAIVSLTGLLLASCSSGHRPSSSTPATAGTSVPSTSTGTSSIHWTTCSGRAGPAHYQCATLAVPKDPSDPSKGTVAMAIDRRPASGHKIGSLLVNPGGPGASGVDFLPDITAAMPPSLLSRFDVVGFDPPGVDRTDPIVCLDSAGLDRYYHQDPAPSTPAGVEALIDADRVFATGCRSRSGAELSYVSTIDATKDMDLLRAALGDSKLTYAGWSYGTLLGATYADLFPGNVRAIVLDGAVDPALPALAEVQQQAASFDAQLRKFFATCPSKDCAWNPHGDPVAAYQALLSRVRTSPLDAAGTSRRVGPAELIYGTAAALYSTDTWTDLGEALQAATDGDGTLLLELFDAYTGRQSNGTYTNILEANSAIGCLDQPSPSAAQIEAAASSLHASAPVFGLPDLYGQLVCTVWPVPSSGHVGPIHAAGAPPILVVGSTDDPATPYQWAQSLAGELQSGVLLTRLGGGHTAYQASSCVRSYVDNYLTGLTLPPAGTRCPSD